MAETAETPWGSVAYSVSGDGPPIVLLPGFQSDRTGWLAPSNYVDLLADFRVIRVDPIGHGRSATPHGEDAYTASAVVTQVVAVLDAESVDRAVLWGFSRGGLIAALCSESIPDRCLGAIFGAAPLGSASEVTMPSLLSAAPLLAAADWAGYWASYPLPLPKALTEHFERSNDPISNAASIRGMATWRDDAPRYGLGDGPVPRCAYFGTGEEFADALRAELRNSPVEIYERDWAGHAETMLDAEGVVDTVRPFLHRVTTT